MKVKIYEEYCGIPNGFNMPDVKVKECYNNVALFCIENRKSFEESDMKIAYGFVRNKSIMEGSIWFRHCFILYKDSVIEVTPIMKGTEKCEYIIMETFKSINELLSIDEYNNDTSLSQYLLEKEKEIVLPLLNDSFRKYFESKFYSQDYYFFEI